MKTYIKLFVVACSLPVLLTTESCVHSQTLAESSFSIDDIKSIEVKGGFCNVKLTGTNGNTVHFEGYIKGNGNPDRYEIRYREEAGVLEVWVESPGNIWGNIRSMLDFQVPMGTDVKVDNNSGNIETVGMAGERLILRTTSGNINMEENAANLEVHCTSGNVELNQQRGNAVIEATSGNVKCMGISGDLRIETSSGNIEIRELRGKLSAVCTSGNIRLVETDGMIAAQATSGNIDGSRVHLTGNSNFKANSGNITLDITNNEEELSFDLDSGSGNLHAAGTSGDDNLIISRGSIEIRGVTTSGNQRYVTGR